MANRCIYPSRKLTEQKEDREEGRVRETEEESDATKRDEIEAEWSGETADQDDQVRGVKGPHPPVMVGGVTKDERADNAAGEE